MRFAFMVVLAWIVEAAGEACKGTSIAAFGAAPSVDTYEQALTNGRALQLAFASNATDIAVPEGRWSFLPAVAAFQGVSGRTLCVDGILSLYTTNFTTLYPRDNSTGAMYDMLGFEDAVDLTLTGNGVIDGRGSEWWWYKLLFGGSRPVLLRTSGSRNVRVTDLTFHNSPANHVDLTDTIDALVHNVTVLVDLDEQLDVLRYAAGVTDAAAATLSREEVLHRVAAAQDAPALVPHQVRRLPNRVHAYAWALAEWRINPPFPMVYALNTDGIDASGVNITVTGCSVTNFDDSVCVKPIFPEISRFQTPCTTEFRVIDTTVTYGVGLSIGSVPPDVSASPRGNCIDGVVISNATFFSPLKAVYVKPNPAKPEPSAHGTIANVRYENLDVRQPLWWAIWVSTQQMNEDGHSTGCSFLYPILNTTCPTDPQVSIHNLTLTNVTVTNPVLSPGVLRANASNPATGVIFDNVVVVGAKQWPATNYICEGVVGTARGKTSPVPPCFT